jgi:hypothetical protein
VVGLQVVAEHRSLIRLAAVAAVGQIHPQGHVPIQRKLRVQPPGMMGLAGATGKPHRLGDSRERRQQRAVHQRDGVLPLGEPRIAGVRHKPGRKLGHDVFEQFRIKHPCRFGKRPQRSASAAEQPLHFPQLPHALDASQGIHHGTEQKQQNQSAVFIHVQLAIAGPVTLAADAMQTTQQRQHLVKVLHALYIALRKRSIARHHTPAIMTD